ncbi:MAG: hypothetical protein HY026_08950 [Deltaproteobacteria bacterium]|nr:hypothetical protein [Deltaproteobacteria bacterium]
MKNMNRDQEAGGLSLKLGGNHKGNGETGKRRSGEVNSPVPRFFVSPIRFCFALLLLTAYCPLSYAAQEVLKTSKIKVGEKIPLTETLKEANEHGKIIVLVLLSNPMQCNKCDSLVSMLEKETESYKNDAVFIMAGGQDMTGAASEETIALKKLYGFVTIGESWTFIIDKQGVLRKIFIGAFNQQELKDTVNEIIGRKQ